VDIAVSKRFYVTERQRLTAQAVFFNALNHPNFGEPVSDINSPVFGFSQSTVGPSNFNSRVTQLSLRYEF
jgi:hypothetical protein